MSAVEEDCAAALVAVAFADDLEFDDESHESAAQSVENSLSETWCPAMGESASAQRVHTESRAFGGVELLS